MHGGNIWAAARATGRPASQWLDFSASINPLGTPGWVRTGARTALHASEHYPDPDCTDLVEAAAGQYRLDPACIRFGNGAAELIHLLVTVLQPPSALLLAPTFGRYGAALRQVGAQIEELPAWPQQPDPAGLEAWLQQVPAGSVAFLCNPNNPTGRLLPRELLRTALAQDRVWTVVDEAFLDFTLQGKSLLPQVGSHPRLVVLRSMTKMYAIPGLRLGWLAGPPQLVQQIARLQIPWSVNSLAIGAGLAALTGPDWVRHTQRAVVRERAQAFRLLAPLQPLLEPQLSDTNYYLVRLQGTTGSQLQERLLPHGILVRQCSNFSGLGNQYIRLAVRPRRETEQLVEALETILS